MDDDTPVVDEEEGLVEVPDEPEIEEVDTSVIDTPVVDEEPLGPVGTPEEEPIEPAAEAPEIEDVVEETPVGEPVVEEPPPGEPQPMCPKCGTAPFFPPNICKCAACGFEVEPDVVVPGINAPLEVEQAFVVYKVGGRWQANSALRFINRDIVHVAMESQMEDFFHAAHRMLADIDTYEKTNALMQAQEARAAQIQQQMAARQQAAQMLAEAGLDPDNPAAMAEAMKNGPAGGNRAARRAAARRSPGGVIVP